MIILGQVYSFHFIRDPKQFSMCTEIHDQEKVTHRVEGSQKLCDILKDILKIIKILVFIKIVIFFQFYHIYQSLGMLVSVLCIT